MKSLFEVSIYALIPFVSIIIGGIVGVLKKPSAAFNSSILHFAAGVVFSVVAVELLPDIIEKHSPIEVTIGFSLGVATMLLVKYYAEQLAKKDKNLTLENTLPIGLLVTMVIDLLVDGLLLGVGFAAGDKEGILLSVALAFEVFALGLALSLTFKKKGMSTRQNIGLLALLGLTFCVGALIGISLLSNLSTEMLELVLSFGLAALLFLVIEELLTEAHEEQETLFQTTCFFAGFLLFLIIGMMA